VANLKQIGLAMTMYADDRDDYYPPGFTGTAATDGDWALFIGPYVAKNQTSYGTGIPHPSKVFVCPSVNTPGGKLTRLTYSVHPALCGQPSFPTPFDGKTRRTKVTRVSEMVLVTDGNMGLPAGSPATAYNSEAIFGVPMVTPQQAYSASAADNDSPLIGAELVNNDPGNAAGLGYIRWRHARNKAANFLFCDGHVESLFQTQLRKKNVRYDP
jgi:prepilin-type processing-associated H-X9-DG protein